MYAVDKNVANDWFLTHDLTDVLFMIFIVPFLLSSPKADTFFFNFFYCLASFHLK